MVEGKGQYNSIKYNSRNNCKMKKDLKAYLKENGIFITSGIIIEKLV